MKRVLTNNIGLKIVSVIAAALLWIVIINIIDPIVTETFYDIPVTIVNEQIVTDKGYKYNIETGEKIDVKVKGKRTVVESLKESNFVAAADFSTLSDVYLANITVTYPGIEQEVLEIAAKTEVMSIKLEGSETLPFNVQVNRLGKVREGYYVTSTVTSPNILQVTGSKTQVGKVAKLAVEVDVENTADSFEDVYTPVAYDAEGKEIDSMKLSFSQDEVQVAVTIYPIKEVPLDIVLEGTPAYGYRATEPEFAPSSITIAAPEDVLRKIDSISVPYDITEISSSIDDQIDIENVIADTLGDDIFVVSENKSIGISIGVEEVEFSDLHLDASLIEVKNKPKGLKFGYNASAALLVRVTGTKAELKGIKAVDFKPYIDLAGFRAGSHTVPIRTDYVGKLVVNMGNMVVTLSSTKE